MIIGASQFKNQNPEAQNINTLISGSNVIALTVNTTDCNFNNFQRSLSLLSTITVQSLNNGEPITVNSIEPKPGYYYYSVEPFPISSPQSGLVCNDVTLNPFLEAIGFENSDFNILFNNAFTNRQSEYIQDVDRARDSIKPSNIVPLLEDTALKATVPDSNYTSLAHTLGRYLGSTTSEEEYGTNPLLGLIPFEGSVHQATVTTGSICSTPFEQRSLETLGFDSSNNNFPNINNLPTASIRTDSRDGYIIGSPATITATQTQIDVSIFNINRSRIQPGRILYITNNTVYDYAEIKDVAYLGVRDGDESNYRLTILRGLDGTPKSITGNSSGVPSGTMNIKTVDSDTVYEFENNEAITLSNKKLYIQETGEIYKVGNKGRLLYRENTCN